MSNNTNQLPVNRQYKARIFEMLYQDKKELLELYNAVNGTNYKDPDQLEINTLENAIYMAMHNDISSIFLSRQIGILQKIIQYVFHAVSPIITDSLRNHLGNRNYPNHALGRKQH